MDNQMFAHRVGDTEDKSFAGTEKVENNFFIGSVHDVAICMGGGGEEGYWSWKNTEQIEVQL